MSGAFFGKVLSAGPGLTGADATGAFAGSAGVVSALAGAVGGLAGSAAAN